MQYECNISKGIHPFIGKSVMAIYKKTGKLTYLAHYYEGEYYKKGHRIAVIRDNILYNGTGNGFICALDQNFDNNNCDCHINILINLLRVEDN